jgi:hypothetical protein
MSLKDLGYKPRRTSLRIVMDDELRRHVEDARTALNTQRRAERAEDQALGTKVPEYEQALADAEAEADSSAVTFTFEALPRHKLAALVEACPPSVEDLKKPRPPQFDVEKFTPRLIAASMVEPESDVDEVVEMWEQGDWSDAIWGQLWSAAWGVNEEVTTRPTSGNGSRKTPISVPDLITP